MLICQFINQDDEIKSATSQNIEEYAAIDPTVLSQRRRTWE
jgi:predicted nucleic-acid-binding protein